MKGLYHVLKKQEKTFLGLRRDFGFRENIGFGSLPIHHHWVSKSMPFTALPLRENEKGEFEVNAVSHWFPEWHNYDFEEGHRICGLKGTTIVKPKLIEGRGYLISAYMYRSFLEPRYNGLRGVEILHPAFTEMPLDVFRGGLALMLGELASQTETPEKLRGTFSSIHHAELDEPLAYSLYLEEVLYIKKYLSYWKKILQQFFSRREVPEICKEEEDLVTALNNSLELIAMGITAEKSGEKEGEAQFNMLRDIIQRERILKKIRKNEV